MINKIKLYFSDYTNLIIALLLLTTFSGALRKWAGLPSLLNNVSLLLLIITPSYLLFLYKSRNSKPLNAGVRPILHLFCGVLLLLSLNPLTKSYFHGIVGFFLHLSFIGIILSYFKNKTTFNEKKIIKLFFIVLPIQLIIASIQYTSPTDSFINRYADNRQQDSNDTFNEDEEFVQASATVGDAVRVTGTFSYLAGYTAIIFFFLLFTFYLSKTKNPKYLFYLSPIIVYAALLSGSRGTVGFTLILLVIFIIAERKILVKNTKSVFTTVSLIGILLALNFTFGDKLGLIEKASIAYENFMQRVEVNKEESEGRITGDIGDVFTRDFDYRYTGVGLGTTYQGANIIFGTSDIVAKTPIEGELFRIIVEGGILLLFFRIMFLIIIFKYFDFPLLLKSVFFISFCIFSQNIFNIYNAIYFAIGLTVLNQAYLKKV